MPAFFIEQFGCRATQADGAALERQLLDRGCTSAPTVAAADIVVVNTCTVTASADAQARDAIRKLHAANPAVCVIVTGCYAQRAPEELAVLPGVSWVVGNSHKPQIPQLIDSLSAAAPAETAKSANDFSPAAALSADTIAPYHSFVGAQRVAPYPGEIDPSRYSGSFLAVIDPSAHTVPPLGNILTGNIFDQSE